jgi:HEAT repeat protein
MADVSAARLEKLLRRLGDDDPVIRIRAASLISAMGLQARTAIPALLDLLTHPSAQSRNLAAWTLGNLGQHVVEVIPLLRKALQDSDEGVRNMTRQALDKIMPFHPQAKVG